ncbi:MAG: hypothetical protein HFH32_03730 [Eubacterium sp.]|jgi:hypothetical protein|nr:hypothetical protein [Eubacterium sp.]
MNQILKNKAAGFYAGLLAAVLCLVSAAAYGISFSSIIYKEPIFDVTVCILLAVTAVASIVMLCIDQAAPFAPVVLCAGSGISLLMYVHAIIWPVSDTIYGIEPFGHMSALTMCAVLLVLSFVVSEAALYMKKIKAVS